MEARGRGKQYRLVSVNDTLAPVASIEDLGIPQQFPRHRHRGQLERDVLAMR